MCQPHFSLYTVPQWELLKEQVFDRYGTTVLEPDFNLESIGDKKRRQLIEAFKLEFERRKSKLG